MLRRYDLSIVILAVAMTLPLLCAAPARATLKIYYDPVTGNVSFDTAETRSGELHIYFFMITDPHPHPWEFRSENALRLSNSTLFDSSPTDLGEWIQSKPVRGLYSLGDILPTGLSESFWTTAFFQTSDGRYSTHPYIYNYVDVLGGGQPPPAEFIYGKPSGEFANRVDLIDPDTLNWASAAKLIYRPWSGEVLVDNTGDRGGYIVSLLLQSKGKFLSDGFAPFTPSPLNGASNDTIGVFGDVIEPGIHSLGTILPAGLTAQEFKNTFTSASFLARAGFKQGSFDFANDGMSLALQYVPEPSSIVLLATSLLALWWQTQRKTAGK